MKKSNKISVFYFLSSFSLLCLLFFGGIYGIYMSVGLNFVRGSTLNSTGVGSATSVAFGGSVNFEYSMSGVIILSVVLVVLAVFDIVAFFKQIVFFKQFKIVNDSTIEQVVERKIKSKKSVIIFVFLIDILSIVAGVIGVFLNARAFAGVNNIWLLYVIDALVALFAVVSMVLLIMKLKNTKNKSNKYRSAGTNKHEVAGDCYCKGEWNSIKNFVDIDRIEYLLLKLNHLKNSKVITSDEFDNIRERLLCMYENKKDDKQKNKAD